MKKIIGLTLAALLVLGMVASGTLAYFSDTETSSGNIFTAGTLDLGLFNSTNTSSTGSVTGTITATAFKPGDTQDATLYVNNEGTIAMTHVTLSTNYTSVTNGTPTTIDAGPGGDTDALDKMIKITAATWGGTPIAGWTTKSLYEIQTGSAVALGSLAAGTQSALVLTFAFDTTATNGCQGDSVDVTLTVVGTQN